MRVGSDAGYDGHDYGADDSMGISHLDWPFLIKVRTSPPSRHPAISRTLIPCNFAKKQIHVNVKIHPHMRPLFAPFFRLSRDNMQSVECNVYKWRVLCVNSCASTQGSSLLRPQPSVRRFPVSCSVCLSVHAAHKCMNSAATCTSQEASKT